MNIKDWQLQQMVKTLEDAINVCYNAKTVDNSDPTTVDQSYPYATGYSRSAMEQVLYSLKKLS